MIMQPCHPLGQPFSEFSIERNFRRWIWVTIFTFIIYDDDLMAPGTRREKALLRFKSKPVEQGKLFSKLWSGHSTLSFLLVFHQLTWPPLTTGRPGSITSCVPARKRKLLSVPTARRSFPKSENFAFR